MSIELKHSFGLHAKMIVFKGKLTYFPLFIISVYRVWHPEQYAGHLVDHSRQHYMESAEMWMDIGKIYQLQAEKFINLFWESMLLLLRETMTSFSLETRKTDQREKVLQYISTVKTLYMWTGWLAMK